MRRGVPRYVQTKNSRRVGCVVLCTRQRQGQVNKVAYLQRSEVIACKPTSQGGGPSKTQHRWSDSDSDTQLYVASDMPRSVWYSVQGRQRLQCSRSAHMEELKHAQSSTARRGGPKANPPARNPPANVDRPHVPTRRKRISTQSRCFQTPQTYLHHQHHPAADPQQHKPCHPLTDSDPVSSFVHAWPAAHLRHPAWPLLCCCLHLCGA